VPGDSGDSSGPDRDGDVEAEPRAAIAAGKTDAHDECKSNDECTSNEMNCSELEELAPLYLSGELSGGLNGPRRRAFAGHLAECRACALALERYASLDERLREAVNREAVNTAGLEASVRARISAARSRNWRIAAAALLVAAAGLGYLIGPSAEMPRVYADAVRDHRIEVVQHRPRRWRSGAAEIEAITSGFDLSEAQAMALAPDGFRLEYAKVCGLAGLPVLHLVYTDGAREVSVYVRRNETSSPWVLRRVGAGREFVDGIRTNRHTALIVAEGSRGNCIPFERSALGVL
jgi:anti-sigma factor RsiW